MMRLIPIVGVAALAAAGCASRSQQYCGQAIAPRDATPRQVTVLTDDLSSLRQAFNWSQARWRVVSLVSPTCSECVHGAEAVQKEITSRYAADQVAALTVWIPMLPTDNEKAARSAATIFEPQRAVQFYDAEQELGTRYAQETFSGFFERARKSLSDDHWLASALDDRSEQKRPQWDLYMLYAPGVRWEQSSAGPPMPTHWIRHLGRRGELENGSSTYWEDTPESGPREGDLFNAIRAMAEKAIGAPRAMRTGMKIEVLGFEGCPHTPQIRMNVQNAATSMGIAAKIVYIDQNKLAPDDPRRGWPAPTVLVDGRDLFGMSAPQSAAMGCRTYKNGAPSEAEILTALRSMQVALSASAEPPMVCTLTPEQLSAQRDALLPGLLKRADERTPLEHGYRLKFAATPGLVDEIARVVERERGCCQFLKFNITVEPGNGPVYLEVTGPKGTRELLDAL